MLSSRVLRTPLSNLPSKWSHLKWCNYYPVVIDGFIYWIAHEWTTFVDEIQTIISFDLTNE